jgi:hypothetical protein
MVTIEVAASARVDEAFVGRGPQAGAHQPADAISAQGFRSDRSHAGAGDELGHDRRVELGLPIPECDKEQHRSAFQTPGQIGQVVQRRRV